MRTRGLPNAHAVYFPEAPRVRGPSRASVGQHLHSGNARRPPILFLCFSLQRHRLSAICKTHNVCYSPLSMAEPGNLSFIFAEGAYYARILVCKTPRDSQCDRGSPVSTTLNREPCSADHLGCITQPIKRIVQRVVKCVTVVIRSA